MADYGYIRRLLVIYPLKLTSIVTLCSLLLATFVVCEVVGGFVGFKAHLSKSRL